MFTAAERTSPSGNRLRARQENQTGPVLLAAGLSFLLQKQKKAKQKEATARDPSPSGRRERGLAHTLPSVWLPGSK